MNSWSPTGALALKFEEYPKMTDPKPTDLETPAPAAEDEVHIAKPHQKDKGKVVTTAFGEKMSGGLADIADGDD